MVSACSGALTSPERWAFPAQASLWGISARQNMRAVALFNTAAAGRGTELCGRGPVLPEGTVQFRTPQTGLHGRRLDGFAQFYENTLSVT
jgi:hypothetical protein